jgi:hypothetical protein
MESTVLRLGRSFMVWLASMSTAVYLMNPGRGVEELFPDTVPLYGNADELLAAVVLFSGLRYFGFDVARFFPKPKPE